MALVRSMGWVALNQWRASSPTLFPGRSPQSVLQRFGHLAVRPCPSGGAQVLVQRVLDEGVGEAVATGSVGQFANQGDRCRGVEDVE